MTQKHSPRIKSFPKQSPPKKKIRPKSLPIQSLRLGIIGDGQLARMLLLAAHDGGLKTSVLSEDPQSPAAGVTSGYFSGSFKNSADVLRFASDVDLLTFESEFVPPSVLRALADFQKASKQTLKIFPSPESLIQFQNRKFQKSLLDQYEIPTSPWISLSEKNPLKEAIQNLGEKIVVKKNMGGYDGNGTYVLKNKKDHQKFSSAFLATDSGFIAEKWQGFQRELALMIGRTSSSEFFHYPLVQTSQKDHRCDWVAGPMTHPKLKALLKKLEILLQSENYVGVMGVELFDLGNELLVNELAPRVHNSGHYTQEAFSVSQFLAHLQCGLGQKPHLQARTSHFVMTNLIGESTRNLEIPLDLRGSLHLYGKNENRPGRKMGHVTYGGSDLKKLLPFAIKERMRIKK